MTDFSGASKKEVFLSVEEWFKASFVDVAGEAEDKTLPFSFLYDAQYINTVPAGWSCQWQMGECSENRQHGTLLLRDPKTGLAVRCEVERFLDYPAVEWIVYFENAGSSDTAIIENLQSIDITLPVGDAESPILHHAKGTDSKIDDFQPLTDALPSGARVHLHSHGCKTSSNLDEPSGSPAVESLPFYNLQMGSHGLIAAFGWTGPWLADFTRIPDQAVHMQVGMDGLHLKLHPGETIRSPRILMLFWQGDRIDAHNRWRRLLREYYSPRPGGKPFAGLVAPAVWGNWTNGEGHIADMEWYRRNNLPIDCYWMDAKWCGPTDALWAAHQSDRSPNPELFPGGIRPISNAAHRRDMKFLLWFVPNSIWPDVDIMRDHPEWLGEAFRIPEYGDQIFYGLDHGDPEMNAYMIEYYSKIITEYGIDIFRVDGTHLWPGTKDSERLGMHQIRYNEGFYAFWEGLVERNPNLLIDCCACGARKLDLETIRRSICLWRSDFQAGAGLSPTSSQAMTYGMSFWVPLFGAAAVMDRNFGTYPLRSSFAPAMVLCWSGTAANCRDKIDVDVLREILQQYWDVRDCLEGDFYPLTPYSLEETVWMAWQFDRPDLGRGIVQAFRREQSHEESATYPLRGLDAEATYQMSNLDEDSSRQATGRELMDNGVSFSLEECPQAEILMYKKLD